MTPDETLTLARAGMWIAGATCFATLIGPILAVQAQSYLDRGRSQKARRVGIFRVLITRRLELSPEVVQAFNAVPIDFYEQAEVITAWRTYLQHMTAPADNTQWMERRVDLFLSLLQKMAKNLDYDLDFVTLKNDFYSPNRHQLIETDNEVIRQGVAGLFSGKSKLPLDVQSFPGDPELNGLLKQWLREHVTPDPAKRAIAESTRVLAEALRNKDNKT